MAYRIHLLTTLGLLVGSGSSALASDFSKPTMVSWVENEPPTVHAYGDTKRGYTLNVKVGVAFANLEDDDQLTAHFKIGGKHTVKCKRSGEKVYYGDFVDAKKDTKVNIFACRIDKKMKRAGKGSVSFDYLASDDEKTYKKVGLLNFEIKKGKKYFYASQDNVVGPVFFIYDPDSIRHRFHSKQPKLWFRTRVKLPHTRKTPSNNKIRCKLDGKKVYFKDVRAYPKTDIPDEFSVYELKIYATHHIKEGSTLTKDYPGNWPFGDNPGQYECRISMEGKTVRKWTFTVDDKGLIQDSCGPALGFDVAHGVFGGNASKGDHKHNKKAAARNLLWRKSVPKTCKGLL